MRNHLMVARVSLWKMIKPWQFVFICNFHIHLNSLYIMYLSCLEFLLNALILYCHWCESFHFAFWNMYIYKVPLFTSFLSCHYYNSSHFRNQPFEVFKLLIEQLGFLYHKFDFLSWSISLEHHLILNNDMHITASHIVCGATKSPIVTMFMTKSHHIFLRKTQLILLFNMEK